MATNFVPKFDVLLALLFPLLLFIVVLRTNAPLDLLRDLLLLRTRRKPSHDNPFSLTNAHYSYTSYLRLSGREIATRRVAYASLPRGHRRLADGLGYQNKLDRLQSVTDLNATITEGIAELAEAQFPNAGLGAGGLSQHADLGRVREALKHFVRDWSEEGRIERQKIFRPILDVLITVPANERGSKKVLVPGSGLGRLAWEIAELGYDTTANELSFFMTLAFRFLLSPDTTPKPNTHTVRPYAHWFSHQRSNDALFRSVSFPDVVPRLTPHFHLAEGDFLELSPPLDTNIDVPPQPTFVWSKNSVSNDQHHSQAGYDYIVTLFFIDTSLNILSTLTHIHSLLRPGGTWINLGPLLWTAGGHAKLELSLEEVVKAAEEVGFIFDSQDEEETKTRTVECEYTGDGRAMMRWVYKAEFWVARKAKW